MAINFRGILATRSGWFVVFSVRQGRGKFLGTVNIVLVAAGLVCTLFRISKLSHKDGIII